MTVASCPVSASSSAPQAPARSRPAGRCSAVGAHPFRTERRRPQASRSIPRSRMMRLLAARRRPAPRRPAPSPRGPRGRSHRPAVRKARPLTCSRRPRSAHRPTRSSRRPPAAAPRSARAAHQAGAGPGFATRDGVESAPAVPTSCVSPRFASPRSPTLAGCADAKAVHIHLGRRPLAGQVPVRDRWIRRDRAEVSAAARTLHGSCASPTDGR